MCFLMLLMRTEINFGSGPVTATTVHGCGPFETTCSLLAVWAHNDSVSIYKKKWKNRFLLSNSIDRHRQVSVFTARSEDVIDTDLGHIKTWMDMMWFLCFTLIKAAKPSRLHLAKGGWMFRSPDGFPLCASAAFRLENPKDSIRTRDTKRWWCRWCWWFSQNDTISGAERWFSLHPNHPTSQ